MIAILQFLCTAVLTYVGWRCYAKLCVVARDTESKEELTDAIEKFAALAGEKKGKVVAFRAKPKDDEA
jgi:hypothetical protein